MSTRAAAGADPAIDAVEQNFWSMFSILGAGPGGRVLDTPTRLVTEAPIPQPPYNAVLRFHDEGDRPLRTQILELVDPMRARGVTPAWLVHPTTSPGVVPALEEIGFARAEEIYGMIVDLDDVPLPGDVPPGVDVSEGAPGDPTGWIDMVSWRYGLGEDATPYLTGIYERGAGTHARLWVARIDGVPVSKVVLHVDGDVAGIYGVATTESGRGRGLASLLTCTALAAARDAGATRSVLHSTPMARSLYRRLGYRDVAPIEVWAEPGRLHL